jgi:putative hydrolase of the HAD superfamily
MIDVIAFDADDTLWHNESIYLQAKTEFAKLFAGHQSAERVLERLNETEIHNLRYYGYGIKSFSLSMIETALSITRGKTNGAELEQVLDCAKDMLTAEVQVLEGVEAALSTLCSSHRLMLVTKGDLFEQDRKIKRSGIAHFFDIIEVVSEKTTQVYQELMEKHKISPDRLLMVGNSLRSDILPVTAAGGQAVYIPYPDIWDHEQVDDQSIVTDSYYQLEDITGLPDLLERLNSS